MGNSFTEMLIVLEQKLDDTIYETLGIDEDVCVLVARRRDNQKAKFLWLVQNLGILEDCTLSDMTEDILPVAKDIIKRAGCSVSLKFEDGFTYLKLINNVD